MNKQLFIDVETTGLGSNAAILQIAYIVRIDGKIHEKGVYEMLPHKTADIECNEEWVAQLRKAKAMTCKEGYQKFISILDKYINRYDRNDKFCMIAYNAPFDNQKLRDFFKRNGDKYFGSWFWNPALCVMNKAMDRIFHAGLRAELPNMKLGTVATYLGLEVEEDKLHDALYDITLTKNLWNLTGKNFKRTIKNK